MKHHHQVNQVSRVLPLLPENYTYEHLNQTDDVLNYKFTVDEIKSKEDFMT